MKDQDFTPVSSLKGGRKIEIRLKARAVSRGIGIGQAVCIHGTNRQFFRIDLAVNEVKPELERLRIAVNAARLQLDKLTDGKFGKVANSVRTIFDAHRTILTDTSFQSKIEENITERKINAEWAVKSVQDNYVAQYKTITDAHLRDRYIDVEDVCERLLTALAGSGQLKMTIGKNSIIFAEELKPSTLVELSGSLPSAIITESGGWTSHTFIIARELSLPAVTGVKKILRLVNTGDTVIVDGYNGQIIINPEVETLAKYAVAVDDSESLTAGEGIIDTGPAMTLDGREVRIFANSDVPAGYARAKRFGAEGIGLYRSEFLFNQLKDFPSEDEQFDAYREIAAAAGDGGVKIRTFDLSVAQLIDHNEAREKNPALGLRSLRLSFAFENHLRTQIRALLRASFQNQIDIVLPMVSGVSEVNRFNVILEEEKEILLRKGKQIGDPQIGAMIELPSAVLMVKELIEATDFLCLGTNDLVQFLLGVDRDNESVSFWFRTLDPSVIRAVRIVISAGLKAEKPVIVCGEMAGSPYYVPILIGLGATNLSMNVNSITNVRKIICGVAHEETHVLTKSIENCRTAEEVEEIITEHLRKHWSHLYPADFLNPVK